MGRIDEESARLKRALGATGPLTSKHRLAEYDEPNADNAVNWKSFELQFENADHDRVIRLSLQKLATAAVDLSGFVTWHKPEWRMRESGLQLLTWGLAQLWEGMPSGERASVRHYLMRTHAAIGWPIDATKPANYDGPETIPVQYQYRIFDTERYVTCPWNHLNNIQEAESNRIEQGQENFLRQATISQIVEAAERALRAVKAIADGDFKTASEWGELRSTAFWPLAFLRRAADVHPSAIWPTESVELRASLADASNRLFKVIGAVPAIGCTIKPEDVNRAFNDFERATLHLRELADCREVQASAASKLAAIQGSGSVYVTEQPPIYDDDRNHLSGFLFAMDSSLALQRTWNGWKTLSAIAINETFSDDAKKARALLDEFAKHGADTVRLVGKHGGNARLVHAWLEAQGKLERPDWSNWKDVRFEVSHVALLLGGEDRPSADPPTITPIDNGDGTIDVGESPMSARELMKRFKLGEDKLILDRLEKRLTTARKANMNCFVEVQNRSANAPKYLYHPSLVRHVLEKLKSSLKLPSTK